MHVLVPALLVAVVLIGPETFEAGKKYDFISISVYDSLLTPNSFSDIKRPSALIASLNCSE